MIKLNENDYYIDEEIQDPIKREEELFRNLGDKIKNITKSSNGWKRKLEGVNFENIKTRKDLEHIPITRKSSLIELQRNNMPYAGFNIKNPKKYDYMFASPGPIYEPGEKGDYWNMTSSLYASGLRKGDLVYNTFSYHLGPAGIMIGNSAIELGCAVVPGGIGNSDLQIATISSLRPDFYIGTPSFLKIIMDKMYENKIDYSFLKNALVGAEPFPKELRKYFKERYQIVPLQMYGTAAVGCIAYEMLSGEPPFNAGKKGSKELFRKIISW